MASAGPECWDCTDILTDKLEAAASLGQIKSM